MKVPYEINAHHKNDNLEYATTVLIEMLDNSDTANYQLNPSRNGYSIFYKHNKRIILVPLLESRIREHVKKLGWELMSIDIVQEAGFSDITINIKELKGSTEDDPID